MKTDRAQKLPLYKDHAAPNKLCPEAHRGLWFDKFCDTWSVRRGDDGTWQGWTLSAGSRGTGDKQSPRQEWLEAVAKRDGSNEQASMCYKGLLEEYSKRIYRLVTSRSGRVWVMRAESRFVTGIGLRHPVENGFLWHPTLGTPYLPGSSIKGMLRAWAKIEGKDANTLLGRDDQGAGRTGQVIVLDALPLDPVPLEVDVITPHYAGWTEQDPPADWRSPNPIPFLTAAAGTTLLFAAIPTAAATANGASDQALGELGRWLTDALAMHGAGAKTAVGYGRFSPDEERLGRLIQLAKDEEQKEEKRRRQALLSATPEGRLILQWEGKTEEELLAEAKMYTEDEDFDHAEAIALARYVDEQGFLALWVKGMKRDGQGTKTNSQKIKKRAKKLRRFLDPES